MYDLTKSQIWTPSFADAAVGFTSTTEVSPERHAEPLASTAAGGEEVGGRVGVPQGDNVKLRHADVSGAWRSTAGETAETSSVRDGGKRATLGLAVLRDS